MNTPLKILFLEDSRTDAEIIQRLVQKELPDAECRLATNKKGFLQILNDFKADVIVSDNSLPGFDASEALQIVRQQLSHVPFILVTGTVSEEFAANIIKQGADDYILKDRLTRLPNAILTAYKKRKDEAERKSFQEQLLEREKQLELFIMHSPASLAMFDTEMRYIVVSNRWCSDFNLDERKVIGSSHYDIFPEIPQRWKDVHARSLKGAIEKNEEDLFIRENGTETWLRWEIRSWYKASGDIGGIIIFTEDVTQKRKAAEEILQTQLRLQQAQEIAHLGHWEVNFETNIVKCSDETCRIYGIAPDKPGMHLEEWLAFIHPNDIDEVKAGLKNAAATFNDFETEHRITRKNGEIRHVYLLSRYETSPDGRPSGLYGITHDITEKKKLQEELLEKEKQEQIKITAITLEAQEKERAAIGQELHDNVNQILVGTSLFLSTAKGYSPQVDSTIHMAMENLKNAIQENRKIAHELVGPDLQSETLLSELSELANTMLGHAQINIHFDADDCDESLLQPAQKITIYRIAQEQCTNIIKYAAANNVTIALKTSKNEFSMQIADDGRGMDPGKKLSGIGIRNINSRLSILNGSSSVTTAPGKGFVMEIKIPLV